MGLYLLIMLMAKCWPKTTTGQWLHRTLVEVPLERAAQIERKHVIFLVVGLFAIQSFAMIMSADMAVVAALDVASYVDVVIGVWTIAAVTRVQGFGIRAMSWLPGRKARVLRRLIGQRARRQHRLPMSARAPANDDDGTARVLAA